MGSNSERQRARAFGPVIDSRVPADGDQSAVLDREFAGALTTHIEPERVAPHRSDSVNDHGSCRAGLGAHGAGRIGSNIPAIMNCECADFIRFRTGLIPNLVRNRFTGSMMAFRSILLKHILPIPDRVPMHDWWIGLVGEIFGKTCFIETPLVLFRRHAESSSTAAAETKASFFRQVFWRLQITWALAYRMLLLKKPRSR